MLIGQLLALPPGTVLLHEDEGWVRPTGTNSYGKATQVREGAAYLRVELLRSGVQFMATPRRLRLPTAKELLVLG